MQIRKIEIAVGIFMAIGLVALFFLAMKVSNLAEYSSGNGYQITARFENVGGVKVRSPVKIAGVRIGQVSGIAFDKETFDAVVTMQINGEYDTLPSDTVASIFTSGLLGEQYIGLEPGGDEEVMANGSEVQLTQSALVLEQIIGQFLFSKAEEGSEAI